MSPTSARSRTTRLMAACLAVGAVSVTAACTGGGSSTPSSSPAPPTSSTPSTHSTPPPTHGKPPARNPFTGIGPVPKNPTISVKIDDTPPGRPQVGIDQADIVYMEAVEGGLDREVAIFGTHMPKAVGYVRSTRPSDPDLLLQFGKITAAYSGGAHDSLPRIHRSGITSWSQDDGRPYYHRVTRSQSDYINVILDLAQVAKAVKTPSPKDIGWTFSKSLKGFQTSKATQIQTTITGSYDTGTPVDWKWNGKLGQYVRYDQGQELHAADGKPIAATNVVVQYCKVVSHPEDTDINGNPSQFTYTVGKGKVLIFRNGKRIEGTWHRKKLDGKTFFETDKGKSIPLNPGNTYVILDRKGIPTKS